MAGKASFAKKPAFLIPAGNSSYGRRTQNNLLSVVIHHYLISGRKFSTE
jgi:hypothetical protein